MTFSELQFGISRLQDGTRVLTPVGAFGNAYEFSDVAYMRYRRVNFVVVTWAGAFAFAIFTLQGLQQFSGGNSFEALTLGVVFLDGLRRVLMWAIFRRTPKVSITPVRPAKAVTIASFRVLYVAMLIGCAFIGIMAVFGMAMDLLQGTESSIALAPWPWMILIGIYSARYTKIKWGA